MFGRPSRLLPTVVSQKSSIVRALNGDFNRFGVRVREVSGISDPTAQGASGTLPGCRSPPHRMSITRVFDPTPGIPNSELQKAPKGSPRSPKTRKQERSRGKKPNILVIIVDDLGFNQAQHSELQLGSACYSCSVGELELAALASRLL